MKLSGVKRLGALPGWGPVVRLAQGHRSRTSATVLAAQPGQSLRLLATSPLRCATFAHAAISFSRSFYASGHDANRDTNSARENAESSTTGSSAAGESVDPVIRACKWESSSYVERLGFSNGQSFTEEQLRTHFKILAKHFHPDSSADGGSSTAAFQNVKEAYDVLLRQVKAQGGQYREQGAGFHYSDEQRRRSQMKALGDGVLLFMFMTLVFIVVVARYSKERLNSRYLSSLLVIFFVIQLFPRLLAAAILYACHVSYIIQNSELKEQANVAMLLSQQGGSVSIVLQGLKEGSAADAVAQVEVSVEGASGDSAVTAATTLTYDKGVTQFIVPVPAGQAWRLHVRVHDERRRQTLVDQSIASSAVAQLVEVSKAYDGSRNSHL